MTWYGHVTPRKHTEAERAPKKSVDDREGPAEAAFLRAPAESLDSILVCKVFEEEREVCCHQ